MLPKKDGIDSRITILYQVDKEEEGQRLDKALLRMKRWDNLHIIHKVIRKGGITLNGLRVKDGAKRLEIGDTISFNTKSDSETPNKDKDVPKGERLAEMRRRSEAKKIIDKLLPVIYEDDELLVINKPSGIPAHGGGSYNIGVVESLRMCGIERWKCVDLVHRIDRATSGVLILAKNKRATRELNKQFASREVKKVYLAIAHNAISVNTTIVDSIPKKGCPDIELTSSTEIEIVEKIGEQLTILKAIPLTGRNHQIRRHLSGTGNPIISDYMYETPEERDRWYARLAYKNIPKGAIMLHAKQVELTHPTTGGKLFLEALTPLYWNRYIDLVKNSTTYKV